MKGASKLRKAFIQYSTWLMEFQKKSTSIGDNEVRFRCGGGDGGDHQQHQHCCSLDGTGVRVRDVSDAVVS